MADLVRGVSYKKEDSSTSQFTNSIPLLRATNVTGSSLTFDSLVYVPSHYVSAEQHLQQGDIVIASSSGSKDVVGKAGQLIAARERYSFGAFCTGIRPVTEIDSRYLGYYFESPEYRDAISDISAGSSINNIKSTDLAAHVVPVAPRAEQTRIVERLEELLSDLDAGVAELKTAQRKLAQYRQSLLKAAVEGALTADWRAAQSTSSRRRPGPSRSHDDQPQQRDPGLRRDDEGKETGAELLQRILRERRARWEQKQLGKFAEQGKTPPKGWQEKYPEPVAPDLTDLPPLPEGWVWASVDQLVEFITSGSRGWAEHYSKRGAIFIRSQNINRDWLDLSDVAHVDPPRNTEGARTRVQKGDLLLTITGANVGKSAVVEVELEEAYVSQHVALIRPVVLEHSNYLHLFLTCKAGGRGQLDKAAYGAGKPGLNLQQVQNVVIPIPSSGEISELLSAVFSMMNAVSTQEDAIDCGLRQAAAQRKNILKAAFSGQLVPQDPSDEPASELLARIRAQREANADAPARKRGRKAKAMA
ncbi:restriction endonuclease subunit S [Lysobacter brunescens]|uniref:Restriction endonuclease subunit S n=1 Tax=Lysobacter brunescens TaxID=262323 RepID=A0ABW2YDR7_9GAMM